MTRQANNTRPRSPGHDGKQLAGAVILDSPTTVASVTPSDDLLQQEIHRLVEAARDGRTSARSGLRVNACLYSNSASSNLP